MYFRIGRHHQKHPTQRTIQTSDITTIVAFALNTCIFRACNNTYKQIRGAGIGSQLSPALCNVAITLIEHSWHQIHNNLLQHTSTLRTIATSTTASLSTTNFSFTTRLSKPSSTTISLATLWNSNRWRIFISSVSTLTSHNAPSPTCNLPNPGKSGIPPPPGASAWLYQASNHSEWWKGLPVAWTSTVKVCVDCCCCQWWTRE